MNTTEIIKRKRNTTVFGCKARGKNIARIIANKTGYTIDMISRILNGTKQATRPHHFMWLRMAEELMNKPVLDDDGC